MSNKKTRWQTNPIKKDASKLSTTDHFKIAKNDKIDFSDTILQQILDAMNNLKNEMSQVKEELVCVKVDIRKIVSEEISIKEKQWQHERKCLLDKVEQLEYKEEQRDRKDRRNNIIIKGFQLQSDRVKTEVEAFLEQELRISVHVNDAFIIKTKKSGDLIIVKLVNPEDKYRVMTNKNKLSNSKIYIFNDRTLAEREVQRKIAKIAEDERKKGHTVRVGFKKITIDGATKAWKDGIGLVEVHSRQSSTSQDSFRSQQH